MGTERLSHRRLYTLAYWNDLYELWETCGALGNDVEVLDREYLMTYLYEGKTYYLYIDLNTPLQINSTTHNGIMIKHYCYDPKFCSNGKSTIEVVLADLEFDYWNGLKQSSLELYKNEKARIANAIIAEIQRFYPEITGKIMMTDVATPVTFKRYCNAHKGSYMSFLTSPNAKQ